MLILMIRTDQPTAELYLYQDGKRMATHSWVAERQLAETINREIDQFLSEAGKTLQQLEGIGVYSGPGSFTSLRIGHSVANALAFGLNLPIVQAQGQNWQELAGTMLNSGQDEHLVLPIYGAPARTTLPRK